MLCAGRVVRRACCAPGVLCVIHVPNVSVSQATAEVSGVLFPKQTVAVVSSAALVGGVGAAPDAGAGSVSSPELGGGVEEAPLEPVQAAEVVCTVGARAHARTHARRRYRG